MSSRDPYRPEGAIQKHICNSNSQTIIMELAEIIEAVKATDPDEFKDALHKGSQPHFQALFNAGHSSATAGFKDKQKGVDEQVATLNSTIEELQGQLAAKDEEIAQVAAKSPDLDKIKTDYEQKLVAKDELVKQAKAESEKLISEMKNQIIEKEKGRVKQELVNSLLSHHVDEWAARKAVDNTVMSRIQIGDDDSIKVYQPDGSTPYMPPEGESPLSLLAKEIVETIPAPLVRPPKNNGSGYQGGGGKSPSNSKSRKDMSRSEKLAFLAENGREAYEALPID